MESLRVPRSILLSVAVFVASIFLLTPLIFSDAISGGACVRVAQPLFADGAAERGEHLLAATPVLTALWQQMHSGDRSRGLETT
jgi:hypothetical protein